ncbi:MAG: hypothetical protein AVDCRST_MAG41-2581, partial [uncultured Corynebacteriales bacterium]
VCPSARPLQPARTPPAHRAPGTPPRAAVRRRGVRGRPPPGAERATAVRGTRAAAVRARHRLLRPAADAPAEPAGPGSLGHPLPAGRGRDAGRRPGVLPAARVDQPGGVRPDRQPGPHRPVARPGGAATRGPVRARRRAGRRGGRGVCGRAARVPLLRDGRPAGGLRRPMARGGARARL